jgi:hypothetical protein
MPGTTTRWSASAYTEAGLIASPERRRIPVGPQDAASVLDEPLVRTPDAEALVGRHARFSYRELDADIALACGRLAKFGIAPRHLKGFRTAADREAGLIDQVVGPALRARNPERRRAGMEDLEALGEVVQGLGQLLFWRALRRLAST